LRFASASSGTDWAVGVGLSGLLAWGDHARWLCNPSTRLAEFLAFNNYRTASSDRFRELGNLWQGLCISRKAFLTYAELGASMTAAVGKGVEYLAISDCAYAQSFMNDKGESHTECVAGNLSLSRSESSS
jgi:hypothetical protein